MIYKIAIIGDKDSILPFKILGFDIFPVRQSNQVRGLLIELSQSNYGIIYITEQLAKDIPDVMAKYRQMIIPNIVVIPNYKGTLNIGMSSIQENVEKAIGTNIL